MNLIEGMVMVIGMILNFIFQIITAILSIPVMIVGGLIYWISSFSKKK